MKIQAQQVRVFCLMVMASAMAFSFGSAKAQSFHDHPVTISMAGSGSLGVNGYDALHLNPATIFSYSDRHRLSFSIPAVSFGGGGQLVNISVYNEYLTRGRILNSEKQAEMLGKWFPNGGNQKEYGAFQTGITTLGISYRYGNHAFAAGHRFRAYGSAGVSKGVFEAAFGGLDDQLFADPQRLDMRTSVMVLSEFSAGWAGQVYYDEDSPIFGLPLRIRAGASPKLIVAYGSFDFDIQSTLKVSGDSLVVHQFNYSVLTHGELANNLQQYAFDRDAASDGVNPSLSDYTGDSFDNLGSPAGYGFGLSFGAVADITLPQHFLDNAFFGRGSKQLEVGFALSDMGRTVISRESGRVAHSGELRWRGLAIDNDWIDNEFDGNIEDYIDFVLNDSLGTSKYLGYGIDRDSYTVSLPGYGSLSGTLRAPNADISLDLQKGFNNEGINSRVLRIGTGIEYRPLYFLPLRTGFAFGGKNGFIAGFGTGLNFRHFQLDLGTSFSPATERRGAWAAFSFGTSYRF
ncbi:MAG: DUF5723 family protein [Balneolia bacterium]|nr:DUF5723 family protein [Balneolia bacterium]